MLWLLYYVHFAAACPNQGAFPTLWDNMCGSGGEVSITSVSDIFELVANAVRIAMTLAGSLAVVAIIVASIYYILSAGDAGRVKQAKTILTNTVIGLFILMGAYAIVTFVSGAF